MGNYRVFNFFRELRRSVLFTFLFAKRHIIVGCYFTLNSFVPRVTHLLLLIFKPVEIISSEKDNNCQAVCDTPRIRYKKRLSGANAEPALPPVVLANQNKDVEIVEIDSRTHTWWQEGGQLNNSLGDTRPTLWVPTQTLSTLFCY